MQWSFPIFRAGETEVRIHLTFFLLLLWIGLAQLQSGGTAAAIDGILFVIAVFACVVLHEFGHVLAGRRYGIRTPKITLLPIGGVAQMQSMPEKPAEEIVVALAGPAVNVAIATILIVVLGATVDQSALTGIENPEPGFLTRLLAVNIILAVFNLIPAFPMDGGRVLRAVLAMRMPRARATQIAATVGQIAAFVFGFIGLTGGSPILVFVAIFVYLAAGGEAQQAGLLDMSRVVAVRDAMITRYETLSPQSTLDDAATLLLKTTQHEFPVVDGAGKLRGVLTRAGLAGGISSAGMTSPVVDAMERDIPTVADGAMLEKAVKALAEGGAAAVGVTDANGRLVGYVTSENIAELMMIRASSA